MSIRSTLGLVALLLGVSGTPVLAQRAAGAEEARTVAPATTTHATQARANTARTGRKARRATRRAEREADHARHAQRRRERSKWHGGIQHP